LSWSVGEEEIPALVLVPSGLPVSIQITDPEQIVCETDALFARPEKA